ncbi:hypothetical protein RCL_jg23116.t1 [Rhizophagus clarus]|uniref:Uncharacterized protein n=1 Tax=Rhizophagus clarus TaxID=94130 RepID=A0A8H3QID5_9GLOM|nr:hypothetical protein RCL_jg23116.t1 [Rhizophagus clarus]
MNIGSYNDENNLIELVMIFDDSKVIPAVESDNDDLRYQEETEIDSDPISLEVGIVFDNYDLQEVFLINIQSQKDL